MSPRRTRSLARGALALVLAAGPARAGSAEVQAAAAKLAAAMDGLVSAQRTQRRELERIRTIRQQVIAAQDKLPRAWLAEYDAARSAWEAARAKLASYQVDKLGWLSPEALHQRHLRFLAEEAGRARGALEALLASSGEPGRTLLSLLEGRGARAAAVAAARTQLTAAEAAFSKAMQPHLAMARRALSIRNDLLRIVPASDPYRAAVLRTLNRELAGGLVGARLQAARSLDVFAKALAKVKSVTDLEALKSKVSGAPGAADDPILQACLASFDEAVNSAVGEVPVKAGLDKLGATRLARGAELFGKLGQAVGRIEKAEKLYRALKGNEDLRVTSRQLEQLTALASFSGSVITDAFPLLKGYFAFVEAMLTSIVQSWQRVEDLATEQNLRFLEAYASETDSSLRRTWIVGNQSRRMGRFYVQLDKADMDKKRPR